MTLLEIKRTTPINGEVVKSITEMWKYDLGHTAPIKERTMNENIQNVATDPVALDHFVLGLDDEGNEVKIKVDEAGELSLVQDIDDKTEEDVTVH